MKKRIFSALMACGLALTLAPAASAASVTLEKMPDVFQGDGVYVTAREFSIPEGWTIHNGAAAGINDGFVTVIRTENVQDADGFYTGTVTLMNWVDEEGNLFDFSDWETPPTLGYAPPDYTFHEGLCYFYDCELRDYGYIDTEGNVAIAPAPQYGCADFQNGFLRLSTSAGSGQILVDQTGKTVFSLEERGWDGSISAVCGDGLFPYKGYIDAGRNTYFVGYLNLQGKPVITLYSGSFQDYIREEAQNFGTGTAFSDGYAVLKDNRGGGTYPSFLIIDTEGNEVLTLKPEAPVYIAGVGQIQDGRFWVRYTDTTPEVEFTKKSYEVLMDLEGNELFRYYRPAEMGISGNFANSVAKNSMSTFDGIVIDINGNTVVPNFTVGSGGGFYISSFNEDNQALGCLSGWNGAPDTYYLLEVRQGTYTGSGTVYNAATGQVTEGGSAPADSGQPSSWAKEEVNAAIDAGIVPQALRSQYTQAATRAEFCALAVGLYETVTGSEITARASFTDTSDVNVEKMAGLGVVNGVGEGKFSPGSALTREQAATMLARLAEAVGKPMADSAPTFADNSALSSWAFDAVGQMQKSGIMGGVGNNTFAPQGSYSREQSIVTMLRLYELVT